MVGAQKYAYTQWSAAYYPKKPNVPVHAIVRCESIEPIVISDVQCTVLATPEDWANVRTIYPNITKHWDDQPE